MATMESKVLKFDQGKHEYRIGRRILPSVTGILKSAGLIDPSFFSAYSAQRGTYAHLAVHYLNQGALDEDGLDPVIKPYVDGYKKFLSETGFSVEKSEEHLYSEEIGFAGTTDLIGHFPDGRRAVIDIKTSSYVTWHECQIAAYKLLIGDSKLLKFGLYLDNTGGYKLRPMVSREAKDVFLAALKIVAFKEAHQ